MPKYVSDTIGVFRCPVRFFLLVGGICGFVLVFVIPPLFHNDEHGHFFRCYSVSEGVFLPRKDKSAYVGDNLPRSLGDLATEAHIRPFAHHLIGPEDVAARARQWRAQITTPLNPEDRTWHVYWNAGNFGVLCYAPSAAAIGVGRLAGCSPLMLVYLGRLANLCAWLLIVGYAIRVAPALKWFIVAYALMPMNMIVASVLSADMLTNAACLLLLAMVLRCAWGVSSTLAPRHYSALFLCTWLVMMAKPGYGAFAGLVLLIPVARFGSWRRFLGFLAAYSGWVFLWFGVAMLLVAPTMQHHTTADPVAQRQFVMDNPSAFLHAAWRTLSNDDPSFVRTFFGFIYAEYTVSSLFSLFYGLLLVLLAAGDGGRACTLAWWRRIWIVFLGGITVAGVCFAIYLYWTPLKATTINWVFGRIFLPLIPLAGLVICNRHFPGPSRRRSLRTAAALMLLVASGIAVFNVHYIFAMPHHNLIPNGNLTSLSGPAGGPEGWQALDSLQSAYSLEVTPDGALRQQWQKSDRNAIAEQLFGVTVRNVERGRRYYFRAKAETSANYTVHIDAWQQAENGHGYTLLKRDITHIRVRERETCTAFHGAFTARTGAPILITVSSGGKASALTGGVIWRQWSLTEDGT